MSATNAPYGLMPVMHGSGGQVRNQVVLNGITSGYASDIGFGTPVRLDPTTRKIVVAPATGDIYGVFAGVIYKRTLTDSLVTETKSWVANTTYVGDIQVLVWTDPNIIYKIQANGSLLQANAFGNQANLVNPGVVSSIGDSTATISTTLAGTGVQAQLRIIDLHRAIDNAWGDAFTQVQVQIAQQQYVANKVAV